MRVAAALQSRGHAASNGAATSYLTA